LSRLYIHYGRSASDRRAFAALFVPITITTAIVIVVVKSSLALSLGLVGALSIVRFRSAVREHEELAFLFLSIALGLCLGADQVGLALLAFALVAVILIVRGVKSRVRHENLYVRLTGPLTGDDPLRTITDILTQFCTMVKLKRCDITDDGIETTFLVEFRNVDFVTKAQNELKKKMSSTMISIIDGEGIA
jgi:uncharacterized membrane protein YhiD involved in acid resistance